MDNKSGDKISKESRYDSPIVAKLVIILYYLLVLGYLITLEGKSCNCIRDWRHDFLKYYSMLMIIITLIFMIFSKSMMSNKLIMQILQVILMIAFLINVWCLYTYIGDLDATMCSCSIEKQKNMHYFLYIWRYILVGSIIASLVIIIISSLIGGFLHK